MAHRAVGNIFDCVTSNLSFMFKYGITRQVKDLASLLMILCFVRNVKVIGSSD